MTKTWSSALLTVVTCSDSIKDAMVWSESTSAQSIEDLSLAAIQSLVKAYPPHLPKARGPATTDAQQEEQKKMHDKDYPYGDYVGLHHESSSLTS